MPVFRFRFVSVSVSLLVCIVASASAKAAERGFYAGAAISSVSADYAASNRVALPAGLPEGPLDTVDLEPLGSRAWRVIGGYRVFDWLAVEANYTSFDGHSAPTRLVCVTTPCPAREHGDANSFSLSALAIWANGPFDVYARGGMGQWRAAVELFNADGSRYARVTDESTKPVYGAGVQWRLSRVAVRLEYERVSFGDDTADLATLGLTCRF
ncbi:MAG TPA: outer membrane beta-barrel protein [Steroidobacteraceae bacterium]|nr:outer membrane beta-barrel protein [Steroidobacteraceae bacterium]